MSTGHPYPKGRAYDNRKASGCRAQHASLLAAYGILLRLVQPDSSVREEVWLRSALADRPP